MAKLYSDNSLTVGNTPLVRINHINPPGSTIYVKLESRNPSNSIKCRIGANMIKAAEENGSLWPGKELVEPTSGNTGIALAFVAAARGYPLTLTMPNSMSLERRKLLKALGARLVLTDSRYGMKGAIDKAEALVSSEPERYTMLQQFENPANPEIHELTTGPEIWNDTKGAIDVLVAGVGTGGTITGVSRYIKNTQKKRIQSIAVEPEDSPLIGQSLMGQPLTPRPHKIQGIGANFIPKNLDLGMIDKAIGASNARAIDTSHRLMKEEGILAGISSGAAMSVAIDIANDDNYRNKVLVVILPDSSERYLSSPLFHGVYAGADDHE
ncbi:MAG: cysteine synthase A [Gammaproteobacteria bacterium]|nr:cysteine synthase A [Gammaproteobacteria bacterium]